MLFDLKLNECKKNFFVVAKKVWCNTDKINEQKKVQKIIAQTYVN